MFFMATCTKFAGQKKLWIGNLDKRLTEYSLLKVFQCYGEVENFEYLFHTVGPNKGEPRTYCFIEYKRKEDAECALKKLNGKVVLSQALRVRWAEESAKIDKHNEMMSKAKGDNLRTEKTVCFPSHHDKIKAIEEKLKTMEQSGEDKVKPVVFYGKHPLLLQKPKETPRKTRQKKKRPYPPVKSGS